MPSLILSNKRKFDFVIYNSNPATSDGTQVVPKLQASSHYFLDNSGFNQSVGQAFGATSEEEFRTTTRVSTNAVVRTMCMGQFLVQPQTNISKVNLILRPFKQPILGLSIKYIIYRGLDATKFIAGANVAAMNASGFATYIRNEINQFYAPDSPPSFASGFIGYPDASSNQADTDLIDKYFFKITEVLDDSTGDEEPGGYELPMIPAGIDLGAAPGDVGIDIILNSGDYSLENDTNPFKLDLAFARAVDGIISTANETDPFKVKLLKEASTRFIDLAAFYGLHANGVGKLYIGDPLASTDPLTTKTEIFAQMGSFITKNNQYLYIQSNRQRSYNFYNNYITSDTDANNIKVGTDESNLVTTTFGSFGWPVHVVNLPQDGSAENGSLCFQLITDGNAGTTLFVQNGFLTSPHDRNFVTGENILPPPPDLDAGEEPSIYTNHVVLGTPKDGTSSIATMVQLIYEGSSLYVEEYVTSTPPEPRRFYLKDIDDLFGPVNATSSNTTENDTQLPVIIGEELQVISFPTESETNTGVVRVKRVEDLLQTTPPDTLHRVTYETLMSSIGRDSSPLNTTSSGAVDSASGQATQYSGEAGDYYRPAAPYYLSTKVFTDSFEEIIGVELFEGNGALPTKKILGITKEEHDRLGVPVSTHNLNTAKIYFEDTLGDDSNEFITSEGIGYKRYNLFVIAEDSSGDLKVFIPDEGVIVYSTDGLMFFSRDYSEYLIDTDVEGDGEGGSTNITLIEVDLT